MNNTYKRHRGNDDEGCLAVPGIDLLPVPYFFTQESFSTSLTSNEDVYYEFSGRSIFKYLPPNPLQ